MPMTIELDDKDQPLGTVRVRIDGKIVDQGMSLAAAHAVIGKRMRQRFQASSSTNDVVLDNAIAAAGSDDGIGVEVEDNSPGMR